jgi:hypothetical protein
MMPTMHSLRISAGPELEPGDGPTAAHSHVPAVIAIAAAPEPTPSTIRRSV